MIKILYWQHLKSAGLCAHDKSGVTEEICTIFLIWTVKTLLMFITWIIKMFSSGLVSDPFSGGSGGHRI